MFFDALFSRSPVSAGHSRSSASGCAATAASRSSGVSVCTVRSAIISPRFESPGDFVHRNSASGWHPCVLRKPGFLVRQATASPRRAIPVRSCFRLDKTVGHLLSFAHSDWKDRALAGTILLCYSCAVVSRPASARAPAGGTQRTGTRDEDSKANAVPCGPGLALARLTPATRMQGWFSSIA